MITRNILMQAFVVGILAAFSSAAFGLIIGLWRVRSFEFSPDTLLLLVFFTLTLLPVTLLSNLCAHYLWGIFARYGAKFRWAVLSCIALGSPVVFALYMNAVLPASNWQRGWWLPLIASTLAIGFGWSANGRRNQGP